MTTIYVLVDPRTGEIRYVGSTCKSLRERVRHHRTAARKYQRTHVQRWIRGLLSAGLEPSIVAVESVSDDRWEAAERDWITWLRESGVRLTNHADGGRGRRGYSMPPESRARMSALMTGRVHSEETRARISASKAGVKLGPLSEERREALRAVPRRPPVWTPESRARLSATITGRTRPPEDKEKIAAGMRRVWKERGCRN